MRYTTETLQQLTNELWEQYCEVFPKLVKFDPPKIVLNNRFTRCAGCCHTADNRIDLGAKFFAKHAKNMVNVILPHEIAHQIDYNLNGWYDRKLHHGKQWRAIMEKMGQNPAAYHSMEL